MSWSLYLFDLSWNEIDQKIGACRQQNLTIPDPHFC